jgi:hypothetical protein
MPSCSWQATNAYRKLENTSFRQLARSPTTSLQLRPTSWQLGQITSWQEGIPLAGKKPDFQQAP